MKPVVVLGLGAALLALAGGGGVAAYVLLPGLRDRAEGARVEVGRTGPGREPGKPTAGPSSPAAPAPARPDAVKPDSARGQAGPSATPPGEAGSPPAPVEAATGAGSLAAPGPGSGAARPASAPALAGADRAGRSSDVEAARPGAASPVTTSGPGTADNGPERRDAHLVRLYEGMKPKEAAGIIAQLDPELGTTILLGMRERQASRVLGLLPAQKAADLTTRIARAKERR